MKKTYLTLSLAIALLLGLSCQSKQEELKPTMQQESEPVQVQEKRVPQTCVEDKMDDWKIKRLKSGIDTLCDKNTGQRAAIHYLTKSQYDSLAQYKNQYTQKYETLFEREYAYWDSPEEFNTPQFNVKLDSVLVNLPFIKTTWQNQLSDIVLSHYSSNVNYYYRPGSAQDMITGIFHYPKTDDYIIELSEEHTSYGFWLNEKSSADSLLLLTNRFSFNGNYLASIFSADCDYCTDIHIYQRNPKTHAVEEIFNYFNHDFTLDSAPLLWVGPRQLLCADTREPEVYVIIELL